MMKIRAFENNIFEAPKIHRIFEGFSEPQKSEIFEDEPDIYRLKDLKVRYK